MPINFIVNDPGAGTPARVVAPSADRPAGRPSFRLAALPAEQVYPVGSAQFLVWQAREAALRTLDTFEDIAGPLPGWTGKVDKTLLDLLPDEGEDLNAYYDRGSIAFFQHPFSGGTCYSGASTDVVAHETGHAILDATRPDLWGVKMIEVDAFHEGFGDCIAIMTALSDRDTRLAILDGDPTLDRPNFVEATGEEVGRAVADREGPDHPAAAPRHARNDFRWQLPGTLPHDGKPDELINESHSLGRLVSGCYYDLIRAIFRAGPGGEAGLWGACETATRLLAEAAMAAPIKPRFFEAIGGTMILVDRNRNLGENEAFIRATFERHGIAVSVARFSAPRVGLVAPRTGAARRGAGRVPPNATRFLSTGARRLLHAYMGVDAGTRFQTHSFEPLEATARVVGKRAVDLTGLAERLRDAKAITPHSALVGAVDGMPAVLGEIDPGPVVDAEVRDFVSTLVARGQIEFRRPGSRIHRLRAADLGPAPARESDGARAHRLRVRVPGAGTDLRQRLIRDLRFSTSSPPTAPGFLTSTWVWPGPSSTSAVSLSTTRPCARSMAR
jgi:hypothetical protein